MITLTKPDIAKDTLAAMERVLTSNRFTPGPEVDTFEKAWAAYCGMRFGVACNSGTTALEMAFRFVGVKRGDKVLAPAFACVPVVTPLLHIGAEVALVDCGPDGNVTVGSLHAAYKASPDARVVVIVHTYGNPVGNEVFDYARHMKLTIIEDCAEAHGVMPQGDIACFSFRGDKMITSGGAGGMCVTDNIFAAEYMKAYTLLGLTKPPAFRYDAVMLGNGIQMGEVQAAFGNAQIKEVDRIIEQRRSIALQYGDSIRVATTLPEKITPKLVPWPQSKDSVFWRYPVSLAAGINKVEFIAALDDEGVEAMTAFRSLAVVIPEIGGKCRGNCVNARMFGDTSICLPIYSSMSEDEFTTIMEALAKATRKVCSTGG